MEAAVVAARLDLEADPPKPPPRGLSPLLRFTRLPERALAAVRKVLEDDEAFRLRVRAATNEQLIGRASWLFLDRPAGWEEELGGLAQGAAEAADAAEESKAEGQLRRRVAVLESTLDREADELARIKAELAEAKDQLTGERRARRRAESDAGRLRRQAGDLAAEVEELRHRRAALQEALDQVDQIPLAPAPEEPELPPPRPAVDHVELAGSIAAGRQVLTTLSEALAEAERLLAPALAPPASPSQARSRSSPPEAELPGLERRRPTSLPPGTFDDSVEAADHLVLTPGIRILVDGYNVTKSSWPELALVEQRRWLADATTALAARTGGRFELVFDGADERTSVPASAGHRRGVQVRFTAEGVEADDVLLELVEELPLTIPVVVVSDDRRVREGAQQRGANVMSVTQFLHVAGRSRS